MPRTRLSVGLVVTALLLGTTGAAHAAPPDKGGGSIAVTLTSTPDTVAVGERVVYAATVKSEGVRLDDVVLADALPSGMQYVSATPDRGSCTFTDGVVRCSLGRLERKTQAEVRITVTAESAGSISNTVDVTATAAGSTRTGTASVTTTVTEPASADSGSLSATFSGPPQPALVGTQLQYTGSVTNRGPTGEFSLVLFAQDNWTLGQPVIESFRTTQGTCTLAPATNSDLFGIPVRTPLPRESWCDLGVVANGQTVGVSAVLRMTSPTTQQLPLYARLGGIAVGEAYGTLLATAETVVTTGTAVGDCALTEVGNFLNVAGYVECATRSR